MRFSPRMKALYRLFTGFGDYGRMKKTASRNIKDASVYFLSRGIYWLALAILCPMLVAYFQAQKTGEEAVRVQAGRVLDFFVSEAENVLGETELMMDAYLLQKQGSCAAEDILELRRYLVTSGSIAAAGIVAADGRIACSIGESDFDNLSFPQYDDRKPRQIEFAELRTGQGSLPVLIKANRDGIRIYTVISKSRFEKLLLPDVLTDFSEIDLILPKGGLWYSAAGAAVANGFSGATITLERISTRFPVRLALVLDKRAIDRWSGSLRVSFIVIVLMSFGALVLCFLAHNLYRSMRARRMARREKIAIEHARLQFDMMYQPLVNMDTNLLVGVLVRADTSLFDKVPHARPQVAEILHTIWSEIGEFAMKRREFNLIVEVDGEAVVDGRYRPQVVEQLKAIGYGNLTLLMKWPANRGVDPDLYRPLEEVATAGANLAIECGSVRFSLLSDMWAWPYHQLVIDFAQLPDAEEAIGWIGEIVMNMSEELHIGRLAVGLNRKTLMESAVGSGFQIGCGNYIGPPLKIGALLSAVRPVRNKGKDGETEEAQRKEVA